MQHNQGWFSINRVAWEPRSKLDSQEPVLKPGLSPETEKYEDNQEMSHRWIPWHTGAKFFKRIFEKFQRRMVQLLNNYRIPVQRRWRKKSGIPHQHALLHTRAKNFLSSRS